jgi:hypothetical protein
MSAPSTFVTFPTHVTSSVPGASSSPPFSFQSGEALSITPFIDEDGVASVTPFIDEDGVASVTPFIGGDEALSTPSPSAPSLFELTIENEFEADVLRSRSSFGHDDGAQPSTESTETTASMAEFMDTSPTTQMRQGWTVPPGMTPRTELISSDDDNVESETPVSGRALVLRQ